MIETTIIIMAVVTVVGFAAIIIKKVQPSDEELFYSQLTYPRIVMSMNENDRNVKQREAHEKAMIEKYNRYGPNQKGVPVYCFIYTSEFKSYSDFVAKTGAKVKLINDKWESTIMAAQFTDSYYKDLHQQNEWIATN